MDQLSDPGKNGTAFEVNWLVERLANLSKESSFSSFEARFVAFKSVICGGKMVTTFRNSGLQKELKRARSLQNNFVWPLWRY